MNYFPDKKVREQELKIQKASDNYMIGKLVDGRSPTNYTVNDKVQFFVEPLCNDPDSILDIPELNNGSDTYIGFAENQSEDMLPQFYFDIESSDDRQDEIEKFYRDKLIIFHPKYTFNKNKEIWFKNLNVTNLIEYRSEYHPFFLMTPKIPMEPKEFEQKLQNGDYFDLPSYDGETNESPEFIICGSYVYMPKNDDSALLQTNKDNTKRWKCNDVNNVNKIDLTKIDDYKTGIIRADENIVFMDYNLVDKLNRTTDFELFEVEKAKIKLEEISNAKQTNNSIDVSDDSFESDEEIFLNGLEQLTIDNGLQYKKIDLVNFHTSVKTNPLVILAGMSGTGKSRLALNYAKMLDLSEDNGTLLFLPISPSYTEPSDVLGYINSMNGLYIPSESGLVQFLKKASENTDQMHMVIFDEMNLSQVEYWFSPFISILEKDRDDQFLTLYSSDAHCINSQVYPPKIKIGENVVFIGTVNLDDTTKNFSDRLLDRTFVINLSKVSFSEFYSQYKKHESEKRSDLTSKKCKNVSQFKSWVKSDNLNYMKAFDNHHEELDFFDELSDMIGKYIPNGGISHRVMKNIGNYIMNVPETNVGLLIDRSEVIDVVTNQTVLTKIRGSETQLSGLIGHFDDDHKLTDSDIITLLDKYSSISEFKTVRKEIEKKAEELRINGFAN